MLLLWFQCFITCEGVQCGEQGSSCFLACRACRSSHDMFCRLKVQPVMLRNLRFMSREAILVSPTSGLVGGWRRISASNKALPARKSGTKLAKILFLLLKADSDALDLIGGAGNLSKGGSLGPKLT